MLPYTSRPCCFFCLGCPFSCSYWLLFGVGPPQPGLVASALCLQSSCENLCRGSECYRLMILLFLWQIVRAMSCLCTTVPNLVVAHSRCSVTFAEWMNEWIPSSGPKSPELSHLANDLTSSQREENSSGVKSRCLLLCLQIHFGPLSKNIFLSHLYSLFLFLLMSERKDISNFFPSSSAASRTYLIIIFSYVFNLSSIGGGLFFVIWLSIPPNRTKNFYFTLTTKSYS